MSFTIASSVDEALTALAAGARPIAGGTDLVVGVRQGKASLPESLVAIDRIENLRQIQPSEGGLKIGAAVTHASLMVEPAVTSGYTALADASALVGSPSTRNVGTLGGNVMNASPAMDTGASLMVLGAMVEVRSVGGSRTLTLDDLWTGPGQTSADPTELCVAIVLPQRPNQSGSAYVRLEYRRAMEIAVVGSAASITIADDGTIESASVALTSVAPTILGVNRAAESIVGLTPAEAVTAIASIASEAAQPISDLRASDAYRRHTVGVMASRAVDAAARRAVGEKIGVPVNRAIGVGAAR